MPSPSRAERGTAEAGLLDVLTVFLERSNRRGLGLVFDSVGEPGSFLTTIFGPLVSSRDLGISQPRSASHRIGIQQKAARYGSRAYDPGGDDLERAEGPAPFGLLLPPGLLGATLALALVESEAVPVVHCADDGA